METMETKKIGTLMMSIGGAVAAGTFGYTQIQKGRSKEVPASVTNSMYIGLGVFAIGVAIGFIKK